MLHIHNGDSTAGTLREFGFPGEHFAFQEVLMAGPTPKGLSPADWRTLRAKFLSDEYELKIEDCERNLVKQEAAFERFREHDEAVLWFEHELFCQVNLVYLLDWFSKQSLGSTKLSLICINQFPGVEDFRGLGQLTGEQLAWLFDERREVSNDDFDLAQRAWAAYCSNNPEDITSLISEDTSALPFLKRAFQLHLQRFPSATNGLGRIENKALELISEGPIVFKSLFPRFAKAESAYGLGDSQFWNELKRLAAGSEPLISITGLEDDKPPFKDNGFHKASFELNQAGRAVLTGEGDFIEMNGIDRWLGGVHLTSGNTWRWDERHTELVHLS